MGIPRKPRGAKPAVDAPGTDAGHGKREGRRRPCPCPCPSPVPAPRSAARPAAAPPRPLPVIAAEASTCTKCALSATRNERRLLARESRGEARLRRRGSGRRRGRAGPPVRRPRGAAPRQDDRRDGPRPREGRLRLQHHQVPSAGQSQAGARSSWRRASRTSTSSSRTMNPKAIVALGNTAVAALLGTKLGITKVRGQWKLYRGQGPRDAHVSSVVLAPPEPAANRGEEAGVGRSASRHERAGPAPEEVAAELRHSFQNDGPGGAVPAAYSCIGTSPADHAFITGSMTRHASSASSPRMNSIGSLRSISRIRLA